MSDLNGGGVLHLVSEQKVTGFDKEFLKTIFKKVLKRKYFQM